ncbi:unnamed protein product [Moneuplotes crassus]|uniref:Uncharacterized protein n=1 Tax=Euplotes crassus TaxID=5936 RepID=A0AAD1Y7Z1_EUPCR|nr:unnamed protein product [Moneuplotes crassus]
MNSQVKIHNLKISQDIWDCSDEDLIDGDECIPQVPHFTKQFSNTLKHNKGSTYPADFEDSIESVASPTFACLKPRDEEFAERFREQKNKRKTKKKLRDCKPKTFDAKTSSKCKGLNLSTKDKKLLRRISSKKILQVLLT